MVVTRPSARVESCDRQAPVGGLFCFLFTARLLLSKIMDIIWGQKAGEDV
jgi:hypothetical protein